MKKGRLFSLFCAILCVISLTVQAFALETRASEQIHSYDISVSTSAGSIDVAVSVEGKTLMDKLGCQSIYVYRKDGTSWVYAGGRTEGYTGMTRTQKSYYSNTISLSGTAGTQYRVEVTIFAEDSAGRDTRSQTFYVTGK
ncbi:MAG: hypothetical protein HFF50_03900 [Lawsonibacter sp.]|nr:hypothetical protein [Lawsonibacter sp.]